ncbi:MAG: polymer-forming cytoskeletal protein [Erysipelotrichia bacterium]|nr:polymer-forming cytoskeletal protein [Erysipelotrichia bacterium]
MSEKINSNDDLQDILNDIDELNEEKEPEVPLFQNMKIEKPFSETTNVVSTPVTTVKKVQPKSNMNSEYTVIGNTTVIQSNVTCGGSIKINGQIKGKLVVNGSADIYGSVDGDIEAGEVIVENGAKVNGNIFCKSELNVGTGSNIVGNISAKNAYINSNVCGNLEITSELKLTSTATVNGDIVAGNISVASGALLNGRINIKRQ